MPYGDRTGPDGYGPMTGRGLGFCAGYSTPGYVQGGHGYGRGYGFGYGRGYRRGYGFRRMYPIYPPLPVQNNPYNVEEEQAFLKSEADYLRKNLESIEKRLDDLQKKNNLKDETEK